MGTRLPPLDINTTHLQILHHILERYFPQSLRKSTEDHKHTHNCLPNQLNFERKCCLSSCNRNIYMSATGETAFHSRLQVFKRRDWSDGSELFFYCYKNNDYRVWAHSMVEIKQKALRNRCVGSWFCLVGFIFCFVFKLLLKTFNVQSSKVWTDSGHSGRVCFCGGEEGLHCLVCWLSQSAFIRGKGGQLAAVLANEKKKTP